MRLTYIHQIHHIWTEVYIKYKDKNSFISKWQLQAVGYERFGDMLSEEHHIFCIYLGDEKMQYEFGFALIDAN